MQIRFLGACGTVTGSSFFLSDDTGRGILVDAGMYQGPARIADLNYRGFGVDPSDIDAIVLTHAHLDHCGRLPILSHLGYQGPIFMTEPTWMLSELTLLDAAKVQRENDPATALFTVDDVGETLRSGKVVGYDRPFPVGHWMVTLRDAGHIMGSAVVEVEDMSAAPGSVRRIVFSGDLGNTPSDLLRPTEHTAEADVVVMESTYGDHAHTGESAADVIAEEMQGIEKSGETLLMPSFAVERTQELLHIIDHLKKSGRVSEKTQVFLDSPMAIKATRIYRRYRYLYGEELALHAKTDDPFHFPGLVLVEDRRESEAIDGIHGPKVIIAGGGMMNGGRIVGHAIRWLGRPGTRLLFTGYQSEETIGRSILDGARVVRIGDTDVEIAAGVRKMSALSAHADQPKLIRWLSGITGVRTVFLVHGEDGPRKALKTVITEKVGVSDVHLPVFGETVALSP